MHVSGEAADAIGWLRHLHAYPELSFREHETARFVRETLASFDGVEIEQPTETSVIGRIRGARPGRTIALRSELDALPIQETSDAEFASRNNGVMHACGHDGHAAMLLAVGRLLSARRAQLAGEVRLIFQHAEEQPPGGAVELVAAGVLDGVDAFVACHLLATTDVGKVAALDGYCTAGADTFSVTIQGNGGHAAFPHQTVDPVVIAAQAIANLQHVVSRATPPLENVVLSVTRIAGGVADNVIPSTVEFGGTVRIFSEEARERTQAAMQRILDGVTAAHGANCEFNYVRGFDPVRNDPRLAALVRAAAGPDRVIEMPPIMAGDDFSAYLQGRPGCLFFVGCGSRDAFPNHHPGFTIDERALPVGMEMLMQIALRYLSDSCDDGSYQPL